MTGLIRVTFSWDNDAYVVSYRKDIKDKEPADKRRLRFEEGCIEAVDEYLKSERVALYVSRSAIGDKTVKSIVEKVKNHNKSISYSESILSQQP